MGLRQADERVRWVGRSEPLPIWSGDVAISSGARSCVRHAVARECSGVDSALDLDHRQMVLLNARTGGQLGEVARYAFVAVASRIRERDMEQIGNESKKTVAYAVQNSIDERRHRSIEV